MKLRHTELTIESNTPFKECKLKRHDCAITLTHLIENYKDGFVLAINNEWGTGKTTFIKMWDQYLKDRNYSTIYFNSWENDLDEKPLIAIISELKKLTKNNLDQEKKFNELLKNAATLSKKVVPKILKEILKKYIIDSEVISTVFESTAEVSTEYFENEVNNYIKKKDSILAFRENLKDYLKSADKEKPVVYFIDELDRCRPNYAVETLEQLKHFFSVEGIIFVLSIDKKHLGSSIKGFYGSESINSDEYLRRFIDLEYSLPKPDLQAFCSYLFHYYSFKEFFYSQERLRIGEFKSDHSSLLIIAEILANNTNTTLRQLENIFSRTRTVLNFFNKDHYVFPHALIILMFINILSNDLYKKIEGNLLSVSELDQELCQILESDLSISREINVKYIKSLLIYFYNNNQEFHKKLDLCGNNKDAPITHIDNLAEYHLSQYGSLFVNISRSQYANTKLDYLLRKVSLVDSIIINS